MRILEKLEPKEVFMYFEDICSIPHGSGNTQEISDYCVNFAYKHNLDVVQDSLGNIIINKPGTKGYEDHPAVILQGHLDMVCEKDDTKSSINMDKDGLELIIDDDYIHANGTTLGGDDGIAIAYTLAILASDEISHPPLVALFTIDEETGLIGAAEVDLSSIDARTMINLDSEEEGVFLTSCAGGATISAKIPIKRKNYTGKIMTIKLDGLKGGHSGTEIDKNRGNSNKIMARFLNELSKKCSFHLADIHGGLKHNAIPLMTEAVIITEENKTVSEFAQEFNSIIKNELKTSDSGVNLSICDEKEGSCQAIRKKDTLSLIRMFTVAPNGVQTMSSDIKGLVESSVNFGVLKADENYVYTEFSIRSSVHSLIDEIISRISILIEDVDGIATVSQCYPAWEYKKDSKLRDTMVNAYEDLFGSKPKVTAIHAGLETGLFSGKLEGLDCISIGPQMYDIHTSKERLSISSTQRVWKLIVETLKRL